MQNTGSKTLKIGLGQMSPVWLNRKATIEKIESWMERAAEQDCDLIVFGEALLPGYPFWVAQSDGARFDSDLQKEMYAIYLEQSVCIEEGELDSICALAREKGLAVYLGMMERAANRGGHSLYCSLVYVDKQGRIGSVHRKLQPTYEERLVWSPGDGNGLVVHPLGDFTVGGLNCWENWMPLPRAALYAAGENLHVAVWPGSEVNTKDITRFVARESRSYVVSVSSLLNKSEVSKDLPCYEAMFSAQGPVFANGGSCVAGPNGEWLLEPQINKEELFVVEANRHEVYRERQNFDPSGHYSRPDVTQLLLNKERQQILKTDAGRIK